jgi:hypothetical protein
MGISRANGANGPGNWSGANAIGASFHISVLVGSLFQGLV